MPKLKQTAKEFGPATDSMTPIYLRGGQVRVLIYNLPHDLTPKEAEKINAIISAHAIQTDKDKAPVTMPGLK